MQSISIAPIPALGSECATPSRLDLMEDHAAVRLRCAGLRPRGVLPTDASACVPWTMPRSAGASGTSWSRFGCVHMVSIAVFGPFRVEPYRKRREKRGGAAAHMLAHQWRVLLQALGPVGVFAFCPGHEGRGIAARLRGPVGMAWVVAWAWHSNATAARQGRPHARCPPLALHWDGSDSAGGQGTARGCACGLLAASIGGASPISPPRRMPADARARERAFPTSMAAGAPGPPRMPRHPSASPAAVLPSRGRGSRSDCIAAAPSRGPPVCPADPGLNATSRNALMQREAG